MKRFFYNTLAVVLSSVGTVSLFMLVAWPLDALELSGAISLPDWLVMPIAFAFVGLFLWLTKYFMVQFDDN